MAITDADRIPRSFTGWSRQRWLSPFLLLVVWQLGSTFGLIPPRILAAPSSVVMTFWSMAASGELGSNLLVSFGRVVAGLALGVTTGVCLALISGLSRLGETVVDAPIQMLRTLPILAMVPLFIVWFGIGETPKVGLIALSVLFPIYLNLFAGIRGVDVKLVEAARSFGLNQRDLIWHVILPGALPSFLLGLRFSLSISWLVLVVAEEINASSGLGYLIMNARDFMRTDIIVMCLVIYGFLGLGTDAIVRAIEARALAWRPALIKA